MGGIGNPEIILDCYRLAKHYHVSPTIFLDMTLGEISMHLHYTAEVTRLQAPRDG